MKNRTEENRRNLEMIAPTWTLLGLALTACGGGGGGGSSGFGGGNPTPRTPPTTTPRLSDVISPAATQFGVGDTLSATTDETNEIAHFYALRWDTAIAVLDITGTFDLQVTSKTVTLTATSFGSTTTASWTITGADAGDFIFVQDGAENAVLQTVNPVDYENPRDANRDNVYEITLDAQGGTFGAAYTHILSTGDVDYTITITDVAGDDRPATPPTTPTPTTPPPVVNSPIILRDTNGNVVDSYTFSVDEDAPELTTVGRIYSSVDNAAPGSRIFHEFLLTEGIFAGRISSSDDDDHFNIYANGEITTESSHGLRVAVPLDYETATSHTLTVRVMYDLDGRYGTISDREIRDVQVVINVNDVEGIRLRQYGDVVDSYTGSIDEDGRDDELPTISASVDDAPSGHVIIYQFVESGSVSDSDGAFMINTSSGAISVDDASLLDYETATSHTLTVRVTYDADGDTTTTNDQQTRDVQVVIDVNNVSGASPAQIPNRHATQAEVIIPDDTDPIANIVPLPDADPSAG